MPVYRCLSDSSHDAFRVVAQTISRIVYVTDRQGHTRQDREVLMENEALEQVSCAVCGAKVSVTPDV